jgi:hypothetical protein
MAALIKEMWQADFRARPAMSDVVVRLEACVSVGDVAIDDPEEGSEASSPFAENKDESDKQVHALQARVKALEAEKNLYRHEVAELKAGLLAGTSSSMEHDDDFGILGGMFICTYTCNPFDAASLKQNSHSNQPRTYSRS